MNLTQEQCERIFGSLIGGLVTAGANVDDVRSAMIKALDEEPVWVTMRAVSDSLNANTPDADVHLFVAPKVTE